MEERYLARFNSFFSSEKLSSTYKPVFVISLIAISDYDEQNPQKLIAYALRKYSMSSISKHLSLRVPANVNYRGLKDKRFEQLFHEFFTGVTRRLTSTNEANSELQFTTTTYDSQIQISEVFKLKVLHSNSTEITYTTNTNIANDPVVESIVYTHVANVLYALLMLETGYVNGLMERQRGS